ncbi:hypothetical protein, partial [Frankia sp. EI5c]
MLRSGASSRAPRTEREETAMTETARPERDRPWIIRTYA